jgi:hypothetical protein
LHQTIKNILYILINPLHTIGSVKKSSYKEDFLFFILITLLGSLFYLMTFFLSKADGNMLVINSDSLTQVILLFVINYISFIVCGIFLVLFISLIVHFFLLFTKEGPGKYDDTFKGVIYSGTPVILFLWLTAFFEIFYVLLFLLIWFSVITYMCIRVLKGRNNVQSVFVTLFVSAILLGLVYLNYGMSQCQYCMG